LAKDMGIEVVRRRITREELYIADEVFLCGTAVEVVPVLSVDRLEINNKSKGNITSKIERLYFDIVRGKIEKYDKWLTPIY